MEIKVLGPGCANCKRLYAEAERAIAQSGQPATLTKVEAIEEIVALRHPENAGARDRRAGRGLGPDPRRGGDRHPDHDRARRRRSERMRP